MFLPEPWDEELLSSWLTRAGKYYGRNVRNMSWACFGNIAICHPQFPKHTRQFADILGCLHKVEQTQFAVPHNHSGKGIY